MTSATATTLGYDNPLPGYHALRQGLALVQSGSDLLRPHLHFFGPGFEKPDQTLGSPSKRDATTSVYVAVNVEGEFASHFSKLFTIAKDKSLWLDGADAPNNTAIGSAFTVLEQLRSDGVFPTKVVASAEGGIAICFVAGDKYSDIECLNNGQVLGVTSNRRDRPIVWEIDPTSRGIALASSRVRKFLEGRPT